MLKVSRQKLEGCVWTQFEADEILLSLDMLTPNIGGIGQPKQESWPFEGTRRNCLSMKFYGSYEHEVTLNSDGFISVYSSGFVYQ